MHHHVPSLHEDHSHVPRALLAPRGSRRVSSLPMWGNRKIVDEASVALPGLFSDIAGAIRILSEANLSAPDSFVLVKVGGRDKSTKVALAGDD